MTNDEELRLRSLELAKEDFSARFTDVDQILERAKQYYDFLRGLGRDRIG